MTRFEKYIVVLGVIKLFIDLLHLGMLERILEAIGGGKK